MNNNNPANVQGRKFVLLAVTLSSFLIPFMGSSVNIALPSIGREFNMDAVLLSWVATSYLISSAMFLVPFGRIADIHGRKRIYRLGIAIYTLSSLAAAAANTANILIFLRVMQGVGSAMMFGTGVAILSSVYSPGERGRVIGITVSAVYIGLSVGPFLGGILTQYSGWRSIFLLNAILGTLVISFVFSRLQGEWAEARGESFDYAGSAIYSLMIITLMYGFSHLPGALGFALTASGLVGIVIFVWWEMRTEQPVFDVNIFKNNSVFTFSNLAALINYMATFAVGFLLSLYLQYIKGLEPRQAGLLLVSQPIVMAAFSTYAGKLSDRIQPRVLSSIGMALSAAGLLIFTLLGKDTSVITIEAALVILGFGFALFSSPNMNAIMGSVGPRFYGVASATLATMRLTGQMFSMGIAMLVFAIFVGREKITPEIHGQFIAGVRTAFLIFAILCVLGVFASLSRGKLRQE